MTAPWVWNDDTETHVSRLVRQNGHIISGSSRCVAIGWFVRHAMADLREKTDLDMVASAVAAHLSGDPSKFRVFTTAEIEHADAEAKRLHKKYAISSVL